MENQRQTQIIRENVDQNDSASSSGQSSTKQPNNNNENRKSKIDNYSSKNVSHSSINSVVPLGRESKLNQNMNRIDEYIPPTFCLEEGHIRLEEHDEILDTHNYIAEDFLAVHEFGQPFRDTESTKSSITANSHVQQKILKYHCPFHNARRGFLHNNRQSYLPTFNRVSFRGSKDPVTTAMRNTPDSRNSDPENKYMHSTATLSPKNTANRNSQDLSAESSKKPVIEGVIVYTRITENEPPQTIVKRIFSVDTDEIPRKNIQSSHELRNDDAELAISDKSEPNVSLSQSVGSIFKKSAVIPETQSPTKPLSRSESKYSHKTEYSPAYHVDDALSVNEEDHGHCCEYCKCEYHSDDMTSEIIFTPASIPSPIMAHQSSRNAIFYFPDNRDEEKKSTACPCKSPPPYEESGAIYVPDRSSYSPVDPNKRRFPKPSVQAPSKPIKPSRFSKDRKISLETKARSSIASSKSPRQNSRKSDQLIKSPKSPPPKEDKKDKIETLTVTERELDVALVNSDHKEAIPDQKQSIKNIVSNIPPEVLSDDPSKKTFSKEYVEEERIIEIPANSPEAAAVYQEIAITSSATASESQDTATNSLETTITSRETTTPETISIKSKTVSKSSEITPISSKLAAKSPETSVKFSENEVDDFPKTNEFFDSKLSKASGQIPCKCESVKSQKPLLPKGEEYEKTETFTLVERGFGVDVVDTDQQQATTRVRGILVVTTISKIPPTTKELVEEERIFEIKDMKLGQDNDKLLPDRQLIDQEPCLCQQSTTKDKESLKNVSIKSSTEVPREETEICEPQPQIDEKNLEQISKSDSLEQKPEESILKCCAIEEDIVEMIAIPCPAVDGGTCRCPDIDEIIRRIQEKRQASLSYPIDQEDYSRYGFRSISVQTNPPSYTAVPAIHPKTSNSSAPKPVAKKSPRSSVNNKPAVNKGKKTSF